MSTYQWGAAPGVHQQRDTGVTDVTDEADDVDSVEDYERFLDAPEHAWWTSPNPAAETDTDTGPAVDEADESRDHRLGSLSISFELDDPDPYEVLRVPRRAPWEEILAAYRRQVRWWHPDGLGEASEVEREACEDRIRVLNTAYQELQLRRGR